MMYTSILVVFGAAVIASTLYLGWCARPSADGRVRKLVFQPYVESSFPILLMTLLVIGTGMVLVGLGVPIGSK